VRALVALGVSLLAAAPVCAQTRAEPHLILTIYGGARSGYQLWNVSRQTLTYGGSTSNPPDTITLARQVNSSLTVGGLFHWFSSATFGVWTDAWFSTFGLDDSCAPVAPFQPDPPATDSQHRNRTLCENIAASRAGGSTLGIGVGGTVRLAPHSGISPYLRLGATVSFNTAGTLDVAAPEVVGGLSRVVVNDPSPRRTVFGLLVAAGMGMPLAAGYQFRLEIRDHVTGLERLDGPANALALGPSSVRLFHGIGLAVGFDIVLEQKRGRRY